MKVRIYPGFHNRLESYPTRKDIRIQTTQKIKNLEFRVYFSPFKSFIEMDISGWIIN